MVYQRSYLPSVPVPPPAAPNPGSNSPVSNHVSGRPVEWKGNGNFDIGQETDGGGHSFTGLNIVNVTNMTQAQLIEAAKETNYELKRLAIQERQHDLMIKAALAADNVNGFTDRCYEEPFLSMEEVPPFDGLSQEDYNTIESIRTDLTTALTEIKEDIAAREAVKEQIGELGGPVPLSPTEESTTPTEIDRVKEKVADIEQHLVPEPGSPLTAEEIEDEWPEDIPDLPSVPVFHPAGDIIAAWTVLSAIGAYLTAQRAYDLAVRFNMGWCLEMIRVCLADLEAAKAPGSQEDAFKANLEGLSTGVSALEEGGVFHD